MFPRLLWRRLHTLEAALGHKVALPHECNMRVKVGGWGKTKLVGIRVSASRV